MKILLLQMRALVKLSFLELWRRNDVFALALLAVALMVPLSMASPFGASGATRYLDEVALLLVWGYSLFIAVGTGSRLFPPEFESRTIYPLLSKPISRGRLLFGKYLGACAASGSALLVFYALFLGSAVARGSSVSLLEIVQAVVLHLAFVALAVAASLFGSLIVTRSANLALVPMVLASMFFFGRKLLHYADAVSPLSAWALKVAYAVAPHAEFFDMRQRLVHGWGAVDGAAFAAALAYAAAYTAMLLFAASAVLKRKRI